MTTDPDWEERTSVFIHADRASVDLGMMSLKTGLVVNSGALVALLAFLGSSANLNCAEMAPLIGGLVTSAYYFGIGASAAAIDTAIAYIYQSGIAGSTWANYKRRNQLEVRPAERASEIISSVAVWPMVLLAVASLTLFVFGIFEVLGAYAQTDFTQCTAINIVPKAD
ncbi:hypothetical protein [Parvibaculum sp.]|jgi:hypothetical protein|uniref:hypothetical protein n=1 Tax=Parvibaculum sp. TaxID=2024848 RepID=UPI000C60799C|nr:hypothetical protein [Parvibaculum sp.]MAM95582.1 hypothetical protein [Parvibaculum sp.]HCX66478.1 hypothetical protein [Rhodobiaceae bacterium]